jgi:hypothetical protein
MQTGSNTVSGIIANVNKVSECVDKCVEKLNLANTTFLAGTIEPLYHP